MASGGGNIFAQGGARCIFTQNCPLVRDPSFHYTNMRFVFPIFKPNSFHAILAVTDKGEVIRDSNSYLDDPIRGLAHYEAEHTIYERINRAYDMLANGSPCKTIDQEVCYAMSPFESVNFGHSVSNLFNILHEYRSRGLTCPIVLSEESKRFPNLLTLAQLLFPGIVFIENNTILTFRSVHIFEPLILDILRHPHIIEECRTRALATLGDLERFKNKKIFMPKLITTNANIVKRSTAFRAKVWLDILAEIPDWVYINPEQMDICEIIAYLTFAKTIVTSTGSIFYGHGVFYSPDAHWMFLYKIGSLDNYHVEYYWDRFHYLNCDEDLDASIDTLRSGLDM